MKITAEILSFNSISTIGEVIDGVLKQTIPPSRIVIIDNGSNPETVGFLKSVPEPIEVVFLDQNLGVGAGHNLGWRIALEDPECTHVWSLENDSVPPPTCLEQLISLVRELDDKGTHFGMALPVQAHPGKPFRPATDHLYRPDDITFNGPLIPRETIETVGFIREDFFVDQEDRDYGRRLLDADLPAFLDPANPIYHHGKGRNKVSRPPVVRTYYGVRNEIYLRLQSKRSGWLVAGACMRAVGAVIRSLLVEDQKTKRIQARLIGTWDGLRGNLGKKDYRFLG